MNTKQIREYKKDLKLTVQQRKILIGTLLGDGHLETQNKGRTYRLKIEHSVKQADYVAWLYTQFTDWVHAEPYRRTRNGRDYVGFTTYSHGAFRYYAQQFYRENDKIVPLKIAQMLDPTSLAIWFLDDGSRKSLKHNTYVLHTYGFSQTGNEALSKALQERFGISTSLHKQKQKYWRLYIIAGTSAQRFDEIVRPYVEMFTSMTHKLGNMKPKE